VMIISKEIRKKKPRKNKLNWIEEVCDHAKWRLCLNFEPHYQIASPLAILAKRGEIGC
jgi:hypothetical protein